MIQSESLDIKTLITYHKQEASEELTYIVIMFTIIFGLLSYVGSPKPINKNIRYVISVAFGFAQFFLIMSILGSLKIHDALHIEIRNYFQLYPNSFIGGEESELYKVLMVAMKPHNTRLIIFFGIGLSILVILGLLTVGEGRVFTILPDKSSDNNSSGKKSNQ